jgi:hypothetical protein
MRICFQGSARLLRMANLLKKQQDKDFITQEHSKAKDE